ncbi:MAG: DUF262 domain-containing protein, partial [Pseudomonadota bacterium]|nr:DUF262 domain-containing protein [Pseudomonadota bacterium]
SQQRRDLFEDIRKTHTKVGFEHYMATVVTLSRGTKLIGTDEHQHVEVVDGQQRLTTLIILLKAIEKSLSKSDRREIKMASELDELLVKPETDSLLLLQTNHDTSHHFSNYLRSGEYKEPDIATTLADREILRAIRDCESFVLEWKANSSLVDLLALLKNRLAFVVHEIESESTAYSTFEVLNSRGLDVSYLDRLKSGLMGTAFELNIDMKEELIKEMHRLWADIYRCIGLRQGMDTEALRFAATLWTTKSPSKPLGEKEGVDVLKSGANTAPTIRKIGKWILDVTHACDALKGNRRLNAVSRIGQARLVAAAVNLRNDFAQNERDRILRSWENVTFRIYGMYAKDARTRVGDYVRLAWQIVNEKLSAKKIVEELKNIGAEFTIDGAVDELRSTDCYSDWAEELRYMFFRYEEYLAKNQGQKFQNEQWARIWESSAADSIEHIWPQSKAPESQVHRLGNLVLLPPKLNSKLQAKDAEKKGDEYNKTGLLIAQQVASKLGQRWNKEAVEARENALLEWAALEWDD